MTDCDHPYATEIESERVGWYELLELVRTLDARGVPRARLLPGPRLERP